LSGDSNVMNEHYLKALSIDVLLATAGFNAKHWEAYSIPRQRGGNLSDPHMKALIEYWFPGIYYATDRAEAALKGKPYHPADVVSVTNYRFLDNLKHMTMFWIQDAVILLKTHPEIKDHPPWSTFLSEERNALPISWMIMMVGAYARASWYQDTRQHKVS
jgi:hypothetical protein